MKHLTPRQFEVLVALADGEGRKDAAHRLGISYNTVRSHTTMAFQALETDTLVGAYRRLGWLQVPTRRHDA